MDEKHAWKQIDASPLLRLSCEERTRLCEEGDPHYHEFCDQCFLLCSQAHAASNPATELDGLDFYIPFMSAFKAFPPESNGSFGAYLMTAVKNRQKRTIAEENLSSHGRETSRKIRKALNDAELFGHGTKEIYHNKELAHDVAHSAGVSVQTLREHLRGIRIISLDVDGGSENDDREMNCALQVKDPTIDVEQFVEDQESGHPLQELYEIALKLQLRGKENFGRKYGALLSGKILGFIRNNDRSQPEADRDDRLDHCESLRIIERDNCLWDVLLLRAYVDFSIKPPHREHTNEELPCAALNDLCDPTLPPHQDKTVAAYLNVTKSAVSQRWKTLHGLMAKLRAR